MTAGMLNAGASDWESQGRHWAGDQSEGPAAGAGHRAPRSTVFWGSGQSPLWRMILGDEEREIVWGQSWTLFSRPREATDLSFGKCHSEGWLVGRETGNLLRKKLY